MKEIDDDEEDEEQSSILTGNSKIATNFALPEKIKRTFINSNNRKNENSFLEIGNNKFMIDLIKNLKKLKKEGKNKDDFYSILPPLLKKININISKIVDDNNNTLAHLLINEENTELLKIVCNVYYLLLTNRNEFYDWFLKENNENLTILDMASINSNKEMLEYLYEIISRTDGSKFNFNSKKNNFFHFSAKYNKYFSILFWYDKLQPYFPYLKLIDLSNEYNITPLHYACYHGALNCVELLLDLQADINAIDKDGKSVLTYAVFSGETKIIKKLLIRGANKTIKDLEGKTPYFYAIKNNKFDIAQMLKNYKFDDNIKNFITCNYEKTEINQLKNKRNDFEIIIYLLFYLLLIIIFSLRVFFISNYKDFKSSLNYLKFGIICLGLSSLFLFISFIFIIYFKCIISFKQHIKKDKKNFLLMYDNTSNICIKCIRIKKQNTIHCVVCNLCIDDWDHHCFWLNTCISKNNKNIFTTFLFAIICFLFINIIFSICFLIVYFIEDQEERDKFIVNIFSNFNYDEIRKNMWIWILKCFYVSFFAIYLIFFLIIFVYYFSLIMISPSKAQEIIEVNENRETLNMNSNNIDEFNENLIDSYIDNNTN